MANDTTLILGLAALAGGAYLYTKDKGKKSSAPAPSVPTPEPVVDQGRQPGVEPDAPSTGSGPSHPTELAPTDSSSADELTFLDRFARQRGLTVRQHGTQAAAGDFAGRRGVIVDDKYGEDQSSSGSPFPVDPREAALQLE